MILKEGSESEYVTALQQLLAEHGFYEGEIHDDYTEEVVEAVEFYQAANDDLKDDGIAGPITLGAMGFEWADLHPADDEEDIPEEQAEHIEIDGNSIEEMVAAVLPLWSERAQDRVVESLMTGFGLIAEHLADLHLSTSLELSLFFGQLRQETGAKYRTIENLNYRCSALPKLFRVYRSNGLADEHGRCNGHPADQEAIANHAYANRIGNGDADTGEGAVYRGAGCKQLTGKDNYQGYQDWLQENLPEVYEASEGQFIMSHGAELVSQAPHDFLSAVYFWYQNELYTGAELGLTRAASDHVTAIVNKHTDSYAARWGHTKTTAQLLGVA